MRCARAMMLATGFLLITSCVSAKTKADTELRHAMLTYALEGVKDGAKIRVGAASLLAEGRYRGFNADRLQVEEKNGIREVPSASVDAVWRQHRKLWPGVFKGGIIGFSAGSALGHLLAMWPEYEYALDLLFGTIGVLGASGVLIGGGVGALVSDWEPVYDPLGAAGGGRRRDTTGSVIVQTGFGARTEEDTPDGALGVQATLYAWGGEVFAIGPEIAYQALGDGEGLFRSTAQIRLSTKGRRFRVFVLCGAGGYFPHRNNTTGLSGFVEGYGANVGLGVSHELAGPYRLSADARYHVIAGDLEYHHMSAMTGMAIRW